MLRSLGARTLLVITDIPPGHGLVNSERVFDLALLNRPLMRLTCILASFMMRSAHVSVIGTIACFLEGLVRATGAQDSRRILSNITVYNYDTTHLQENPQRLG